MKFQCQPPKPLTLMLILALIFALQLLFVCQWSLWWGGLHFAVCLHVWSYSGERGPRNSELFCNHDCVSGYHAYVCLLSLVNMWNTTFPILLIHKGKWLTTWAPVALIRQKIVWSHPDGFNMYTLNLNKLSVQCPYKTRKLTLTILRMVKEYVTHAMEF